MTGGKEYSHNISLQQIGSRSNGEDEDVEIGSVQKEDLFNLRQLSVVMRADPEEYGKIY